MFNGTVNNLNSFPSSTLSDCWVQNREALDDSLGITAFALLYNRVNKVKLATAKYTIEDIKDAEVDRDVYTFYWLSGYKSSPDRSIEDIKNKFEKIEKLPTIEKFITEQLKQPVFIRVMPNENVVCIFSTTITLPLWHCAQFFIPKFFPIFKEKPLTKEEISFLETLTYKTSANYVSKVTELANTDGIRTYILKDKLNQFEKKLFEKKVKAAKDELNSLEQRMITAMAAYRDACSKRTEAMALVLGLETMQSKEDHEELKNYLLNNPRICNVTIDGQTISFIVKTMFAPHHIDEWETVSKANKIFYTLNTGTYSAQDTKLLLDALMSENRCMKLKMCAYFEMDYFGSEVKSKTNYAYTAANADLKNYIPNPHLHHHNCFGQNKTAILDQLTSGDAIGAIECCIACAQRINIHDVSFNSFVPDLMNSKGKCLIAEDGTEMTVEEAIKHLKGKKDE